MSHSGAMRAPAGTGTATSPVEMLCLTGPDGPAALLGVELPAKAGLSANLIALDQLEQAGALLKFCPFDLVLLDLDRFFPGTDVLERVRREAPSLPVLLVGGAPDPHLCRALFDLGAVDWVAADADFVPRVANAIRFLLWRREAAATVSQTAPDHRAALWEITACAHLALESLPEVHPAHGRVREILRAAGVTPWEPEYRSLAVTPLLEELRALLRPLLPPRIGFRLHVDAGLPPIRADAWQLRHTLLSLARDALADLGEGPAVLALSARREAGASPDCVRLTFEDHGLGRRFAAPLDIPVAPEPAATAPAEQGQPAHILVVDDDESLLALLELTLRKMNYRATGFTEPEEALARLRQDPAAFQALVTDLTMPGMTGFDLAREALRMAPSLPVILTTGCIRPQDEERARQLGVSELILKPDTLVELGPLLQRHLKPPDAIR